MTKIKLLRGCVFAVSFLVTACEGNHGPHHTARTSLVVIDRSASVDPSDRALYLESLKAIAAELAAGDRVVVTDAGDADRSHFRVLLDLEVPESNVRADQEDAETNARAMFTAQIDKLLPSGGPGAQTTHLLDALAAGAQVFEHRRPGDRVILLSDGIEEGAAVNLSHLDSSGVARMIDRAKLAHLVPELSQVDLIIVGAGGLDATAVHDFWSAYASATGMPLKGYGRLAYRPDSSVSEQ